MALRAVVAAILLPAHAAGAEPATATAQAGEEHEISNSYETFEESSDGSSASARGQDVILERVIAVREDGLELEFDLPRQAMAQDRARAWQFPARVLKPANGPMQLLNHAELEARVEDWLKAAGWPRTVCGRWIFTWNAFRIECDPNSVIETLRAYDLRSVDLREGALHHEAGARAPAPLTRKTAGPGGASFAALLEVDPDAARRARAEADVVLGEISQVPVTLDAALRRRAREQVSGTISVTFDTDAAGNVRRRTKVTRLEARRPDGVSERRTATETVERRRVPEPAGRAPSPRT